jgi:hypothetical protein
MPAHPDPKILGPAAQPDPRSAGLVREPDPAPFEVFWVWLSQTQQYWVLLSNRIYHC